MIDDDETVREVRTSSTRTTPRTFMSASEFRTLLEIVIKPETQLKLTEQLIKPTNGRPVDPSTLSRWKNGSRAIPLWAARRLRELAEIAKRYDSRRES